MSNLNLNTISSLDTGREVDVNRVMQTVDYVGGLVINSLDAVIVDGDDRYVLAASAALPYTTTGAGMPEGGAFVSVGDAKLREDLESPIGSSLVNHTKLSSPYPSSGWYHDNSNVRIIHKNFNFNESSDTKVIYDGSLDGYHRHFGGVTEGLNGRLHLCYRKALQHALSGSTEIMHTYSDDGGATWSTEASLTTPDPSIDHRSVSIGVTPSGRLIVIYDKVPSDSNPPVDFVRIYSDDNGVTWSGESLVYSSPFTYARTYGRVKIIPANNQIGYDLAITPYYQSTATPDYKIAVWASSDDGLTWNDSYTIAEGPVGDNETEIVAITSQLWISVSRSGTGLNVRKSNDGGATWTVIGIVPLTATSAYVAPSLDKFSVNGEWYVILGYCNRTGTTDSSTFRTALVSELLTDPEAWGGALITATDMQNASGYQSLVTDLNGVAYIDGGFAYVEFKEYTGQDYSQVRFNRRDLYRLSDEFPQSSQVASGEVKVSASAFTKKVLIGTEGGSATDELVTITGGAEGQEISFRTTSRSQETRFVNESGNLRMESDFYTENPGDDGSFITLKKVSGNWYEVSRSNDQSLKSVTISSGSITVPSSRQPSFILIGTEGATATDDLDNIAGGLDGQIITLASTSSSQDTTVRDGVGNIQLAANFTLLTTFYTVTLIKRGANWIQVASSANS